MNYRELTDEELASLARKEDNLAVNELLYRHKSTVTKAVRHCFLSGGDHDDLLQEGTIALYNAIMSYDSGKNAGFRTFAYLCVKRKIYDLIRRERRDKHRALNDSVPCEEIAASLCDPEEAYIEEERESALKEGIEKALSDEEKEIFALYLDGLSYSEIAKSSGLPVKKVDNTLQKIKKTLKNYINY